MLFDDGEFSNAKRYFWTIQSLRIFWDHINATLDILPGIFQAMHQFHGWRGELDWSNDPGPASTLLKEQIKEFEALKTRIQRTRQEIDSLNSGVRIPLTGGFFNTFVAEVDSSSNSFFPHPPSQKPASPSNRTATSVC
jgi:hypothetical protein